MFLGNILKYVIVNDHNVSNLLSKFLRDRRVEEQGGREPTGTNRGKGKQLVNLGKGYTGIPCTILAT